MKTNARQITEYGILACYFSETEIGGYPFGENLIVWPQELNEEVSNYFSKCFDWWVEVKEEDQSYSTYTVFEVTSSQAREFIRAANEHKWGLGSHCYAMVDGQFKWGRD